MTQNIAPQKKKTPLAAGHSHADSKDTRMALMLAAGELFAKFGYDAVSTRVIAEAAKVNLGGIHYHFGSKEKLYVEAFLLSTKSGDRTSLGSVADEHPHLKKTPEGQAEVIRITMRKIFKVFFAADKPEWQQRLLLREITDPSSARHILIQEIFKPSLEGDFKFFRSIHPKASLSQMLIWANLMHSQMIFYLMTRETFDEIFQPSLIDSGFFDEAARETAKALIHLLGLPDEESAA